MYERDAIDFIALDDDQKRRIVREAKALRATAIRILFERLGGSFSRAAQGAAAAIRKGWHSYARRLEYRAAVRELGGLDDRSLKDIGLHRSEIKSVVYGAEARREGKVAALFHKPPARRSAGPPPASSASNQAPTPPRHRSGAAPS